ncbi:hypothetical protein ElyMa_003316600 [Elysia marginata]|uniref:Uncharacterized protein n=1 Tax=Elysia marginata TaxID=1093978 RepID=A0AAV4JGS6_9GAST|nr:hypothetical protein ElyMa_003316600 [Elysia marginata]
MNSADAEYSSEDSDDSGDEWETDFSGESSDEDSLPLRESTAAHLNSVYPENWHADVSDTVKAMVASNVPKKSLKRYIEDSQGIVLLLQDQQPEMKVVWHPAG